MGTCKFCGKKDRLISEVLEVCRDCVLNYDWNLIKPHILSVHNNVRKLADLPEKIPETEDSNIILKCNLCLNECGLSDKDTSYCGLRDIPKSKSGALPLPSESKGYIHGYVDKNPTNCCNSWFCPAGSSTGYPMFSTTKGPEYDTYSYAAFLYGCTFNCLFCQNYSHKNISKRIFVEVDNLASEIINNKKITCLCFFGGTPESQLPFSLNLSNLVLEKIKKTDEKRIMRICWEWNGSGRKDLVERCMEIAIKTGGNIKFDLKSYNEKLNFALCGVSNSRTLDNFKYLAENYFGTRRKEIPEMSGCTLMVPGYINHEEVEQIAKFISSINENIPYNLLVFHGDYQMRDLPVTPTKEAIKCLEVAKKYLKNVNLGNKFLLEFS